MDYLPQPSHDALSASLRRAYDALETTEARLRAVVANAPIVLFAINCDGIFTLSEGRGLEPLGLRPGEVVGRSAYDLYRDNPEIVANLRRALSGEMLTSVASVAGLFYETHYAPLRDRDQEIVGAIGVATDVTDRTRAAAALMEQARHDPLMGVLNHAAIAETLQQTVARRGDASFGVAMVDVDGLKAINDTYGHQTGDAVLIAVAHALSRRGAIVGRYGGDELLVIIPDADRAATAQYRDEIQEALASAAVKDPESGAHVPVIASVGIACCPADAAQSADLVRLADQAMYAVKRGRASITDGTGVGHGRASERATRMVGELLPLLTSPGTLEDKLRVVAERLSLGGAYDAVHFETYTAPHSTPTASNTFARTPDELIEAWNREQRSIDAHPLGDFLTATRRPIIFDDPQNDDRLLPGQRAVLRAAGIRSAVLVPMLWQDALVGILGVGSKREDAFTPLDAQFLTTVADQVTAIVRMATVVDDLQVASTRLSRAQSETVIMLAAAAEAHDRATGRHLQRVRALTACLARELGFAEKEAEDLGMAAVLHDIGKIRVPDAILMTPMSLSDEEWALMKQHTVWGAQFLAARPGFELAAAVASAHHERWDGSGYPAGLAGDEIPVAATIVAVADALDAMTNDRPYRAGRSLDWAVREIAANAGAQFSPQVAAALQRLHIRGALPLLRDEEPGLEEAA
ncbi:MAG: diguanylate cyclase [Chloroflexota bacterium]|nr:diguanylate cyclase [Chloroflexota bacterium]